MTAPDSSDSPDGRTYSTPETAGQAHVGRAWDEWYAENGRDRTMMQGFAESKYDAMRRAFHAGAIAAAAPAPAGEGEVDLASNEMRPGELDATLATVPPCDAISSWGMRCRVVRAHETHRDRDGNMWPQPASELAEAVTVEGVLCRDYPAVVAAMQAAGDRRQVLILRLIDERDLARAETATIRAAAANTARELAEVTAERDKLRELVASGEPLSVTPADDVKTAPELAAAMAESRRYREGIARFAGRLEAEAAKDESARERQGDGVSRLLLQRTADLQRLIAADIRKLAEQ